MKTLIEAINAGMPVRTRNGKDVTIFTTKATGKMAIIGMMDGEAVSWYEDGMFFCDRSRETCLDLVVVEYPRTWCDFTNLNFVNSYECESRAEAISRLIRLAEFFNNGWKPEDSDAEWCWAVYYCNGKAMVSADREEHILQFRSQEVAEAFAANFGQQVELNHVI